MAINLPQRRLVSQEDAAMIERFDVPRSRFINSWSRKTAFDAGYLVPFMVDEVLPGDHLSYDVTAYVRMATPLFPLLDNQRIDTFFFYVPNRILWSNWVRFMGEQTDVTADDPTDFLLPRVQSPVGGFAVGGLADHFGIPTAGQTDPAAIIKVNALPFRAYQKIWNDWFRDQNLYNKANEFTGDGDSDVSFYPLRRRAKSHDYFTSALPWPQKFTSPNLPLSGYAPVLGIGRLDGLSTIATNIPGVRTVDDRVVTVPYGVTVENPSAEEASLVFSMKSASSTTTPDIYADLSQVSGVAINTLRNAWLVQGLLERDARGGTRYVELLREHFRVVSPDFRLSRPEYIGGGQSPLQLTPIAQTAPTEGAPVGALGAAGTSVGQHRASFAATEHGFIIGLINVRTELSYQQGLHRMWSKATRYDYPWPSLMGLGEQSIYTKELYYTGVDAQDNVIFGYQERWHEYRTKYSEVTGLMRSYVPETLDTWHLAQRFSTPPVLGAAFIEDTPPMSRVLAAGSLATNQQYLADIHIRLTAVRPVSMYGTPANLGRF